MTHNESNGFTERTTGSPELGHPDTTRITHESDMWSFGCVLSEAATWLMLGKNDITRYRTLRA